MIAKLKKYFLIFTISQSLILRPDCVVAAPDQGANWNPNTNKLQLLLNLHLEMKTGADSFKLINNHGRNLLNQTSEFLAYQKNLHSSQSPDLMELERHQHYLANYFNLKDDFNKCVHNQNNKRQLSNRILESAGQSILSEATGIPHQDPIHQFQILFDFNTLSKLTTDKARPAFQDELTKQILVNTAKSLTTFRYKFDRNFMKSGQLESNELEHFVNQICTKKGEKKTWVEIPNFDVCQSLGSSFRQKLTNDVLTLITRLVVSERRFTPEAATFSLNRSIERLNENLKSIEIDSEGALFSRPKLDSSQIKSEFDHYQTTYMEEIQKDAGVLLLTKTMRDKVGALRDYNEDAIKYKNHSQFRFPLHELVSANEVQTSIGEAYRKIQAQLFSAQNMAKSKAQDVTELGQRKENIKDLVRLNPFSAGQVLIRNPEYAGIMCEAINGISQDDDSIKKIEDAFVIGSNILSVAVLATAGFGGAAIGVAYMKGAAGSTIGSAALKYSLAAGGFLGMTTLTYDGKKSFDKYQETNQIESAYLSRNSDRQGFNEARDSLAEFKEARLAASVSLVSVGLSGLAAGKFFNIFRSSRNAISPLELKAAIEILEPIKDPAGAQRLKDVALAIGKDGEEKINHFLVLLSKEDELTRLNFIRKLNDGNVTVAEIKEIITKIPQAAQSLSNSNINEVAAVAAQWRITRYADKFSSYSRTKAFDGYEWHKKRTFRSELRKQGKSETVATQEAEILAKASRQKYQNRYNQCHAKEGNPIQLAAKKRFLGFSLSLGFAADTYGYTKANAHKFDDNKLQWFSKLGYDLTMNYLFTKFNVKTIGSQTDSIGKKYIQSNVGGAKISAGDGFVYSGIYGATEDEARIKVETILSSPDAQKELRILDSYIKKTNFVQKFEDHVVEGFRKVINSPDKKEILGSPPYTLGKSEGQQQALQFSNLTNDDLKKPEIRKALVRAALMQMNSGELGALLSTGDKGLDRWINDREWAAGISIPKGMLAGLIIYQILCIGYDSPLESFALASGIQFINQFFSSKLYYEYKMKNIGM